MSIIDLSTAKAHIRADDDDDTLIQTYLNAAELSASEFLNRKFFKDQASLDEAMAADSALCRPMVINDAIVGAVLLILGHLYANREDVVVGVSVAEMPMASRYLLQPYRIQMGV